MSFLTVTTDGHDMNNARKAWDEEQIARAVGFTTSRFQGRGSYDTRSFGDLASALADAQGDRRALVYAVTPEGYTIHIINGNEITMTNATDNTAALDTAATVEAPATATLEPTAPATAAQLPGPYGARKTAARAAREALGADKLSGVHFRVLDVEGGHTWEAINPEEPAPAKPARAKADKPAKAPKAPKAAKPLGKRAQAEADAAAGKLPTPPDFSANTHKPFRKKLDEVVALVKAGDVAGLKALEIKAYSTSPKAIARYRDLAVAALEAKATKAAAKAG